MYVTRLKDTVKKSLENQFIFYTIFFKENFGMLTVYQKKIVWKLTGERTIKDSNYHPKWKVWRKYPSVRPSTFNTMSQYFKSIKSVLTLVSKLSIKRVH